MRRATIKEGLGVRFEFDGEMIKAVCNTLYTAFLYEENFLKNFGKMGGALCVKIFPKSAKIGKIGKCIKIQVL